MQVLSLRLITKVLKATRVTLQFQDYHSFLCSSGLSLRYSHLLNSLLQNPQNKTVDEA